MAWDIYGQPLRRGFCEVHPYVEAEYPCPLCMSEHQQAQQCEHQQDPELADAIERITSVVNHLDHLTEWVLPLGEDRDETIRCVERLKSILSRLEGTK
jgi:hypothetical protein